ncbi:peptidyl-prolyl cis-trans isomerase FKBP4 [Halyomorpha halys]|uniref:peptidyl-prolyl cis-trans isomerase FKBP4 n=1 Tax=Halyomorpha halys TaxID=286706 RepID=UPI0006D4D1A5|nr:peptidyl-prolyl cis-trans isomerase FKBP4-like [Halyomorpha halys]XP_014289347.1 peptidyl-prolyl cis-trans isomerase FKBP4-like [Halyomorpha halys]XP_014289348.1 peptidyl-prolyl cis-trans isomerase FKBP4-like [Halyomorpha halys]XP_014289349.1 peptidyl-prolyl cis-trans isomerase FKBP4-like [Halyomorpha halys]XP_024216488.1 peptidyl-prolyl cis-trans isomerase FKBP4-like [Halyomorpha halys]XP_024216489.1 peptidyl-prolyl cis-trans isomerase FKBP4-like [Halyomorpha halys]XP_024216490.1 peptidyl
MEVDQEEKWDWESKCKEAKKKILKSSFWLGNSPIEGSHCKLIVRELEGVWDSEIVVDDEFEFTIGCGDSRLEGLLERCLVTMNKEEEAFLKLDKVSLVVTLLEFSTPEEPVYNYDLETNIKKAMEHKEKGVEHFRNDRIIEAYSRFRRAIRLLIFAHKTEKKVLPLYIMVCNNIALCHLKLNRPEYGIDVSSKVLEHDSGNVKALLRRSACYNAVRDFEKAHADLIKVLEIEPNNLQAKEMLLPVAADLRDMKKRYKNMVMKMFSMT